MRARQRHLNPKAAGAAIVLDSRYITGLSDGNDVTSWSDRSGNSNNATAASNYPTYETAEQGGNPVVRFVSANSDRLNCSTAPYTGGTQRVLIVAYKETSSGSYTASVAGTDGTFTNYTWFKIQSRTNAPAGDPFINCFNVSTGNATSDNLWKIGSGAYDGSNIRARKNGSEVQSSAATLNTNNTQFRLGGASYAGEFMNGDIGYVIAAPITYSLPLVKRLEQHVGFSFKLTCA
jgi:hypothetical protein